MDIIKLLEEGYAWTGQRVARVGPQDLGAATPCALWDVRAVLNHMIGVLGFMAVAIGREQQPPGVDTELWATTDAIGSDAAAAFTAAAEAALAAWRQPGALERECQMPFGAEPGWRVAHRSLTDAVVHGWDLSRGTGENAGIPDELAEPLWEIDQNLIDASLRDGTFGPEVACNGGGASARLVAFLGRQP